MSDNERMSMPTGLEFLELDMIEPDSTQIRKEFSKKAIDTLAQTIEVEGLISPIVVQKQKNDNGKHIIISGERRYRAFRQLADKDKKKWGKIPVTYHSDEDRIKSVLANLAKTEYNPIEYAEALQVLKDANNLKQIELADIIGKKKNTVSEYLSLLALPKEIKDHARADSLVPFNFLKSLAANKELSDEQKIEKYNQKYDEYIEAQKTESREQEKKGDASPIETRRVAWLQKNLNTTLQKLEKFDAKNLQVIEDTTEIEAVLDNIIKKAKSLKQELKPKLVEKFDASNSDHLENQE